ncbi:MSC_0624 family F1-like ATPase-associated membrane protein [Mycoplasmopsis felis]|uniref:Uncharacterized protein n=2 Tax=Mycoplasmopsis felis TaxID=33923 RepID=A0A809RUX9_9BACT|nr:hypothetical protein [Mycoplasmopsis felis]BBU47811.1 hypothetical protein JPM2_5040 [Mycoplasmopsis felis]
MNSITLENRRFYIDYRNQLSSKSYNTLSSIYKWLLIGFLAIGSLMLFLFMDKSLFHAKILRSEVAKYPLEFLFNFENTQFRQMNATIILRFSPLIFVFLYSIFKNYKNINTQKEQINKYATFYVLYFALALISLFLLFFYIDYSSQSTRTIDIKNLTPEQLNQLDSSKIDPNTGIFTDTITTSVPYGAKDVMYLFLILIPLFLVNLSFEIYNHIYKRKSEPVLYSSYSSLIIQLVSQFILLTFILINIFLWRNGNAETNKYPNTYLFDENKYFEGLENIFNQKSTSNLFIVIAIFLFIGISLFGANIKKVYKVSEKNLLQSNSKDKYVLNITLFVFLLLAFFKVMTIKIRTNVIGESEIYNYFYLLFIFSAIIVGIIYFIVVHFNKRVNKNSTVFAIYMTLTQLILWTLLVISVFVIESSNQYVYNIFVVGIVSILIYIHFIVSNKGINKWISGFLRLSISLQTLLMFTFALNQVLVAQNNFVLVSVPTPISIIKIITIINFALLLGFFMCSIVYIFITLQKIESLSNYVKKGVK